MTSMNVKTMTYVQLVEAVHHCDYSAEFELYERLYSYFHNKAAFLPYLRNDIADDLFQEAFLVVWTEIQNGRISTKDGRLIRNDYSGKAFYMSCALTTYLMAVIRNMYNKLILKEGPGILIDIDTCREIMGEPVNDELDEKERRFQTIDDELGKMSPRCKEILTLYYVKGLKLEQILDAREENDSKNGLKTSKSKCLQQLKNNVKRRMAV